MLILNPWIKLHKSFGAYSKPIPGILDQSLSVFENIEYKISQIRKSLASPNLSIQELEALHRYLKSLNILLFKTYQNIVFFSLELLIESLETTLLQENKSQISLKKLIIHCKKVQKECKRGDIIKSQYLDFRIENALERIQELEKNLHELPVDFNII